MNHQYCGNCGQKTTQHIPAGDHQLRQVCSTCHQVHYVNPKMVCGTLITWENKVLLCRRAIEPRYGLWTLPAGYMELFETMEQGAVRESWEETQAKINIEQLYCMYDFPQIGHIYVFFKAQLIDGIFGTGEETLETRLFAENEIPWKDLAFSSVAQTLRHYFADKKQGKIGFHHETLSLYNHMQLEKSFTAIPA